MTIVYFDNGSPFPPVSHFKIIFQILYVKRYWWGINGIHPWNGSGPHPSAGRPRRELSPSHLWWSEVWALRGLIPSETLDHLGFICSHLSDGSLKIMIMWHICLLLTIYTASAVSCVFLHNYASRCLLSLLVLLWWWFYQLQQWFSSIWSNWATMEILR